MGGNSAGFCRSYLVFHIGLYLFRIMFETLFLVDSLMSELHLTVELRSCKMIHSARQIALVPRCPAGDSHRSPIPCQPFVPSGIT